MLERLFKRSLSYQHIGYNGYVVEFAVTKHYCLCDLVFYFFEGALRSGDGNGGCAEEEWWGLLKDCVWCILVIGSYRQ